MSPLIMYMTSSLGSTWNSLRPSRPRATNATESGVCQRMLTGLGDSLLAAMMRPKLMALRLFTGTLLGVFIAGYCSRTRDTGGVPSGSKTERLIPPGQRAKLAGHEPAERTRRDHHGSQQGHRADHEPAVPARGRQRRVRGPLGRARRGDG